MIYILLLLLVVLSPARGHLRAEYAIVSMILITTLARRGLGPILRVRREIGFFFFLSISGVISIAAYVSSGGSFSPRDLLSIVRYFAYGAILAAAASVSPRNPEKFRRQFGSAIVWMSLIIAIISFAQFYNPLGINQLIKTIYPESGVEGFAPLEGSLAASRITGTSGNPNWWGFMIAAFLLMLISRSLIGRRMLGLPILFALATALLLTGSRTAVVAVLGGAMVIGALGARTGSVRIGQIVLSGIVALFVIGWGTYYQLNLAADTERFNVNQMSSLIVRFEVWSQTLEEYKDDLILGRGPAKSDRRLGLQDASSFHVRDNIYVSYLAQYGLVGLFGFLGLCFYQAARLLTLASRTAAPDSWIPVGMLGVLAAWLLFGATGDSFFFVPASNFFVALYGLTIATAYFDPAETPSTPNETSSIQDGFGDTLSSPV